MNYKTYKISELIDEIAMGPFGSNIKVESFVDDGVPVLNGSNLEGFQLGEKSFRYVTEEKASSLGRANAHRGDIIITHRGTLGQIVYIPQTSKYDRYIISQSQFRIKCNEKVLPEYLVYYFHTPIGQHKLLSNASQVGVPALARPSSTFQKIEVEIPDLDIQRRVVNIINSLQNKIVLNNKINDNLEQQARLTLNWWMGEHSREYKSLPLSDIATVNDSVYSPKEQWHFVNYLDTSSITDGIITELQHIVPAIDKLPSRARRKIVTNDIVFSTVRPNQHHFGIIKQPVSNMLVSTGFAVIRSKTKEICNELIYLRLTEDSFIESMQQIAEQSTSTFPSIKPSDLYQCEIPCPIDDKLTILLENVFSIIAINQKENLGLSQLRDALLPKLMNGEIEIY